MIYREYIKCILGFIGALIMLIVLSPLLLVVTVWLHFVNKGAGPFFAQERPGKDEQVFKLYKLKSMTDERDTEGNLFPDRERFTSAGRFIRKTSLDELPQLWNALKGDMSPIGPRPLLIQYLPLYSTSQRRRHKERPGITGWAQVFGRNAISWERKFTLDVWYVDHLSFRLDYIITWRTAVRALGKEGISSASYDTMELFEG